MPVPSIRNPMRPARGLFAVLDANKVDLYEGELVYAIDRDQLYIKEGGVLEPMGGEHAGDRFITDIDGAQPGESLNYTTDAEGKSFWTNGGPQNGGNF